MQTEVTINPPEQNSRAGPYWMTPPDLPLTKGTGAKLDQDALLALLIKLLLTPSMNVVAALCECLVSSSHDYESTCNSLMITFRHNRQDLRLIEWALLKEIESCEVGKTATLFRGMTVGAKLVSIYLHMKGHFFLKGVLQPLIAQMQTSSSIEVDPMKMADLTQLPGNQKRLTDRVEQMFRAMESAIDLFPRQADPTHSHSVVLLTLKYVFQTAQHMVEMRFHEKGYELIGGFFFLRFVCPALVSPERLGLASGVLSAETRRSLILISKVLQNASNDVQFGEKEKYMLFINEWIHLNHQRMLRFLSQLSVVPTNADMNAVATLGKEKMATEEERRMAARALVHSLYTHKEQMSAALAGQQEQTVFDRLIQELDPAELGSVENVTLNFHMAASLNEVDLKRTPESYTNSFRKNNKDKKKENKDKDKKRGEGKDMIVLNNNNYNYNKDKLDKPYPAGVASSPKDDSKVMTKARWRRLNRPAELVNKEELASFSNTLRHVATNETTIALESHVSVLKEQLSAEREVRLKVETELKIARAHLAQETARREALERLGTAMLEKLKSAGIPFSPPLPASPPLNPIRPSPQAPPNLHIPPPLPNPSPASLNLPSPSASTKPSPKSPVPSPTASAASAAGGRYNLSLSGSAAQPRACLAFGSFSPLSSPLSQQVAQSPLSPRLGPAQSGGLTAFIGGARCAPPAQGSPGVITRPRGRSGGTSLIASAYQNSGRSFMALDESQGGKPLTDRLVEKMFSREVGLELTERDGKRCFHGCECVDWLVEELRVGRDKAVVIGDKLLSRGFFRGLSFNMAPFADEHILYAVVESSVEF